MQAEPMYMKWNLEIMLMELQWIKPAIACNVFKNKFYP
jgi:hypothetical protein